MELDAADQLRVLHDFYRAGDEEHYRFNMADMARKGHDFKDYICPDGIEKHSDYLKLGDRYCRVLFLKDYANYIQDEIVADLTDLNRNMMLSIDILSVPTDEAVREVENRLLGVETNITNWHRRQNSNNNFSAVVPYDMELQRKESKEFLADLTTRDQRMMQASFRLGVPGSGKSFSVKEEIAFLILNTDDDILIADPEGEYAPLIEAMDGLGTVVRVAAGGKDRLNAMYMVDGYGENNPIVVKSQFIMSLVERIDPNGVGAKQKSIIDRCTATVYEDAEQTGTVPTLTTLREKLMKQPEDMAREIALALELFTTGSLDIFGHESTVDLDKRVVVFDIHGMGEQLKPIGHIVL